MGTSRRGSTTRRSRSRTSGSCWVVARPRRRAACSRECVATRRRRRRPARTATHDPLFEAHRWRANLRILEIDEIKTVPNVPLSHPFVERLIGTMRREFLDHVLFWNDRNLERKLAEFQVYYNAARSHASLAGDTPLNFAGRHTLVPADLNNV